MGNCHSPSVQSVNSMKKYGPRTESKRHGSILSIEEQMRAGLGIERIVYLWETITTQSIDSKGSSVAVNNSILLMDEHTMSPLKLGGNAEEKQRASAYIMRTSINNTPKMPIIEISSEEKFVLLFNSTAYILSLAMDNCVDHRITKNTLYNILSLLTKGSATNIITKDTAFMLTRSLIITFQHTSSLFDTIKDAKLLVELCALRTKTW